MGIHGVIVGLGGALAKLGALLARVDDRWSGWAARLERRIPAVVTAPPRVDPRAGEPVLDAHVEVLAPEPPAAAEASRPAPRALGPGDAPHEPSSFEREAVRPSGRARRKGDVLGRPRLALPVEWAQWPLVRGKRALMLGGTPCGRSRAAIAATFELASLEWCSADPRRVGATAQRVARGGFDLVFVNKLVRHRDSTRVMEAARCAGVPVVVVRRGFGASAIRQAIERSRGSR